ncbi:MAG TPA: type II CAAX endopeptidase family protein [Baekduia sp.]|nr:type II CAAX endopeptidase family protein [Baekduia sp.]
MTSVDAAPQHPAPPERPELPEGATAAGPARPRWMPWTAPIALLAGFAAAFVGAIVIGVVAAIFGASFDDPPASVGIASVIVQDACLIGSALFFARLTGPPRPRQFGLRRPDRLMASAGLVVAAYVGFIVVSYVWLTAIGQTDTKDTITEDLGAGSGTAALVAVAFVVTVVAPISEEFFFRGYFFGALRNIGLWPAVVITGLAFGLVHVFGSPFAFILPLAFLGGMLCLLREWTASLYPGIALHCLNNSIAFSSSQHWDWQVPVVLVAAPALIAGLLWLGMRAWPGPRPEPARSTV